MKSSSSKYLAWPDYKQGWIFRHKDLPIDDEVRSQIKPLTESASHQFWSSHISREATHASHFLGDDWPARNGVWGGKGNWQTLWDSDDNALPELLAEHIDWQDNNVMHFCYDSGHVVETTWGVFKAHWKNFLFFDDSPLLLGKKRQQVAQFESDGSYRIGLKPINKSN